jgi:hypothetical protein
VTTLLFLLTIAAVAGSILAAESRTDLERPSRAAFGLLTWLTSGNWPAKIGAGLLVVGVGALLRFALQNLAIDPTLKLTGGVAISGLLAAAATFVGSRPQRRAVSLALGGAAFGVAYLTAYSAFALFGYLDSETGTALLLLTAVGASVYAATRSALSLATLAMFGAFLAARCEAEPRVDDCARRGRALDVGELRRRRAELARARDVARHELAEQLGAGSGAAAAGAAEHTARRGAAGRHARRGTGAGATGLDGADRVRSVARRAPCRLRHRRRRSTPRKAARLCDRRQERGGWLVRGARERTRPRRRPDARRE